MQKGQERYTKFYILQWQFTCWIYHQYIHSAVSREQDSSLTLSASKFIPFSPGQPLPPYLVRRCHSSDEIHTGIAYKVIGMCYQSQNGTVFIDGQKFDDPRQGGQSNCAFIAALSSAVWKSKAHTGFSPQTCNPAAYCIKFYRGGTTYNVYIDSCTLDTGATSTDDTATNQEIWPALYEKAYAVFCHFVYNQADLPGCSNPAREVPAPIPWPSTIESLEHITSMVRATTEPILTTNKTGTSILTEMKGLSDSYGMLLYPMIGWVKSDAYLPAPPGSCWDSNPKLVKSPDGHTYSILGVYPAKSTATDIVLRDTYGGVVTGTQTNSWTYKRGMTLPLNVNGVFTISPSKFQSCFYSYQYVKP